MRRRFKTLRGRRRFGPGSIGGKKKLVGFIADWQTANTSTGSSTSTQIALPLLSTGTYNFDVDWGDGNTDAITTWNQAETTHTYSSSGQYTIKITGTIQGFRFNNTGDRLKILTVKNWGPLTFENSGALYGCTNVNSTATDKPTLTTLSMANFFRDATSFNGAIDSWDVSTSTNFNGTFRGATSFNQPLNSWDVSSSTNFPNMFLGATAFDQPLDSWVTSSVTNMTNMFSGATSFDQDVGSWNVTSLTTANTMFNGVTLSTANYDSLLTGWEAQAVQNNVTFGGGNSQYSVGAPTTARAALVSDHTWTITDGGQA